MVWPAVGRHQGRDVARRRPNAVDVPDAIAHHDHPDYHGDLMDVITVDHLIKLRADLIDAVDHHRAVRDGHADLSHPDVIAAFQAEVDKQWAWLEMEEARTQAK